MDIAGAVPQQAVQPARTTALDQEASWLDSLLDKTMLCPAHLPPTTSDRIRGTVALRREQLEAADDLVHRRYAWRGYALANGPRVAAAPLVTLLAQSDEHVVGTLTVRPGGVHGLFAEQSYGAEIEQLRGRGRRIGELVRLAMEEGADWRRALDALVRSAYVITRFMYALSDVAIEVNPRHVRFYQRVFGFTVASAERFCSRVGAPSVLLLLDLEQFGRRLESLQL